MKISHESPLSLLNTSRTYNDYDYALVHLFELEPDYYRFFQQSVNMGRHVLLDNSIFELGTSFDPDRFAHYIKELKPTEYIIPDVLENTLGTITFDYLSNGYYDIKSTNLFVLDKTFVFINLARFDGTTGQPTVCMASYFNLSTINLYSYYYDYTLTRFFPGDDLIINGSLEIRVYN